MDAKGFGDMAKMDTTSRGVLGLVAICIFLMGLVGALAVGWNEYHKGHQRFHECQEHCGDTQAIILDGLCKCVTEPEGIL